MLNVFNYFSKNFLRAKKFRKIELEISTRCPVRCPLCPRNMNITGDKSWNTGFLETEPLLKFIDHADAEQLIFCGGYGDPIYHPDFKKIISHISEYHPEMRLMIETNGSYKKEDWWEDLGKHTNKYHKFSFSIDGLEDSNEKYRVNADWASIISGIKALRRYHKGNIQWKYILFSHNQHQVIEAYKLAMSIGVDHFKLVKSDRHTEESRPTVDFDKVESDLLSFQETWKQQA